LPVTTIPAKSVTGFSIATPLGFERDTMEYYFYEWEGTARIYGHWYYLPRKNQCDVTSYNIFYITIMENPYKPGKYQVKVPRIDSVRPDCIFDLIKTKDDTQERELAKALWKSND